MPQKLPKKIKKLRGYHPDTGEMNQEAFFAASDYITNSLSIPELIGNMQKAVDFEASRGIGMIHSVSGVGFALNLDISMESWFARSLQNGFQLHIFPQSMSIQTAKARNLPRIGGCFACALDGCFGSQDAAMNEPYANDPTNRCIRIFVVLFYSSHRLKHSFLKRRISSRYLCEAAFAAPRMTPSSVLAGQAAFALRTANTAASGTANRISARRFFFL